MNKKYFYIIPLLLLEVMIQLGFFWLAPDNACKWVVYAFLSGMTLAHLIIVFALQILYGIRRSAATIVAGSFAQALVIGASVWLLSVDSSVRSSIFLMSMLAVLYIALVAILWISIEGFGYNHRQYDDFDMDEDENEYDDELALNSDEDEGCNEPEAVPARRRTVPSGNIGHALPSGVVGRRAPEVRGDRTPARRTPPPVPARH